MHAKTLSLAAVLLAVSVNAVQAEDPNVEMMQKLYSKLRAVTSVGDVDASAGNEFLVLANPGTLVDTSLDMTKVESRRQIARVIDRVMLPKWYRRTNTDKVIDVYKNIIDNKEMPTVTLTPDQQKKFDDACKLLYANGKDGEYSADYKAYRRLRSEYVGALSKANKYKQEHPNEDIDPVLADNLAMTLEEWRGPGKALTIGPALEDYRTLSNYNPAIWWASLQTRFTDPNNTDQPTPGLFSPRYEFYPAYSQWTDASLEWSKQTITSTHLEQTETNSSSSVGGSMEVGWGLFSFGGDYEHEEKRSYSEVRVDNAEYSFELLRVEIDRPWMESEVFRSRAWQFPPNGTHAKDLISNGADILKGAQPAGRMMFLPTAILLARNVSIKGTWSVDIKKTFNEHTAGGADVGFGPFSFGGRVDQNKSESYKKGDATENSISFSSPQIIGYYVEILPQCPNRDPDLKFPSDLQPHTKSIKPGIAKVDQQMIDMAKTFSKKPK